VTGAKDGRLRPGVSWLAAETLENRRWPDEPCVGLEAREDQPAGGIAIVIRLYEAHGALSPCPWTDESASFASEQPVNRGMSSAKLITPRTAYAFASAHTVVTVRLTLGLSS
jgi:hypothetical protein